MSIGVPEAPAPTQTTPEPDPVPEAAPESAPEAPEDDPVLAKLMARMGNRENREKWLKALLYGPPGGGKTVLGAQMPKCLIIAVEANGIDSLDNHPELTDWTPFEFVSVKQVELLVDRLVDGAFPEFQTIFIDSFSEFQKRDLDDVVARESKKDMSRDPFLPIGPDYNMNTERMRKLLGQLQAMKRHVILTAHQKEEKDETTGRIYVRPNLSPKLYQSIAGMVSLQGYVNASTKAGVTTRRLQIQPSVSAHAKSRLPAHLGSVIESPNMATILNAYLNSKESK